MARHVLTWILIALFLALALNPPVDWLERRTASGAAAWRSSSVAALLASSASACLFVPTLVDQVNDFADASAGLRRRPDEGTRAARLPARRSTTSSRRCGRPIEKGGAGEALRPLGHGARR